MKLLNNLAGKIFGRLTGLDRVDNNLPHDYNNNIVSCCKYCNMAKGNLTLKEFDEWVRRLAIFNYLQI